MYQLNVRKLNRNHVFLTLAAMITQFLTDVDWGERDYLIIDTPPGTSDEHITVVEQLKKIRLDGAVVVTTPQVCFVFACILVIVAALSQKAIALSDVRRELTFCQKTGTLVLGIVENMSGFVCPHCSVSCISTHVHTLCQNYCLALVGVYQYIFNWWWRITCGAV